MKFILTFFTYILYLNISNAAYYDTLPAGVRNITYRYIQTGEITGSYGSSGNFKGYNVNANINADSIKGVNAAVDTYLGTLSATDYANFSFGTFQGSATSKVSAQAIGAGYGVTNRLTVYGFVPFYSAQVDLKIERTQKGRNNVGTAIQLENLPDVDVRLIQSLFVNYYHYQPLGRWKATDFGDTELGMMYQLKKWSNAGALINIGTVAPTGRKDNPDILQDIAFGDGQWDAFFEWGGGIILSSNWSLDNWTRYTYQFPYSTTIRTPDSSTFPVTANEGLAQIKLGNKAQTNLQANYKLSEEWTTSLTYSFEYIEPSDYKSSDPIADTILEADTEKITHTGRLNLGYSTLSLYQQKKFFVPVSFNLAVQSIFAGKNVPKYERADFEIRLFF
ncbi:MAG: hypothetical protein H7281_01300 [Bacteriovorax sp.]|nr:hypothetical protein [Bacteriovorax sp.]